ncbi:MAG: hypothetical protein QNJ68_23575 [Microcoleaceae cyanobacterium MO_207.B10]|nr:hypothetical protein [Microcoleaceae cyanobacterium MO_207.B10]
MIALTIRNILFSKWYNEESKNESKLEIYRSNFNSPAIFQPIVNPKANKNIALIIITGSLNITQKHTLKAIEKHLQKIAADTELTIVYIDEGS